MRFPVQLSYMICIMFSEMLCAARLSYMICLLFSQERATARMAQELPPPKAPPPHPSAAARASSDPYLAAAEAAHFAETQETVHEIARISRQTSLDIASGDLVVGKECLEVAREQSGFTETGARKLRPPANQA